jgi:hypothetical protein
VTNEPAAEPHTFCRDVGVLAKLHPAEAGSTRVESLCADEANNAIAIAPFDLVETTAAFAAKRRGHVITGSEYKSALADLLRDAGEDCRLVAIGPTVIGSAIQLTRRQKLRGKGWLPKTLMIIHKLLAASGKERSAWCGSRPSAGSQPV